MLAVAAYEGSVNKKRNKSDGSCKSVVKVRGKKRDVCSDV